MAASSWDIACRVVDHYGDVGIAWRLARQLARSGRTVRLAVHGLDVLARIESRVDPWSESQTIDGIVLVPWTAFERADVTPAGTVVELLGCGLPAPYLDALERRGAAAVWIDFEHLSAEAWVDGCHGLPSPQPSRALVKHFFYPGFGPRTGGLLIEPGHEPMPAPRDPLVRTLSLFAYPHAPVAALLDVLATGTFGRWTVIVPGDGPHGAVAPSRYLTVRPLPFTDQDGYDRLLATSDVNFVRGEDSFVRAQVAGRPLVWHAYPQPDRAHLAKLAAFEARYGDGLTEAARQAQLRFWMAWNATGEDLSGILLDWLSAWPQLEAHATSWRDRLVAEVPAVERLIAFADARRNNPPALC